MICDEFFFVMSVLAVWLYINVGCVGKLQTVSVKH